MTPYHILVIDDNAQIRELLKLKLSKLGHTVLQAENGLKGYEILQKEPVHFVITDWMMPDMTGIQLCQQVRATIHDRYVYIILLTARSALEDLAMGMEAGADDFIAKPFHLSELQARVSAGIRILELERQMTVQQRKLDDAYQRIQNDLTHAARLQRSLLPGPCDFNGQLKSEGLFCPSRFLAGDIFNVFQLDEKTSLAYILDVAGKGVPAALLSFTLSKILNSYGEGTPGPLASSLPYPVEAVTRLNKIFHFKGDLHDLQYFTMIYAVIDHEQRRVRMVQAGHPPPVFMPTHGNPYLVEGGGPPVGLWAPNRISYSEVTLDYNPGDRLYLYSDGVSETFDADRECYTEQRLLQTLLDCRGQSLGDTLASVRTALVQWAGKDEFEDDVTMCALEFH